MESGGAKTGKRKRVDDVVADEWWKELPADWWKELGDHLETEILGRLPAEDVYRYRGVCDEWNVLLSSNYFITEAWPDATINKQPWLLLCDPFPNNPSMAFCFYTQAWKRCFSLSLPDGERSVKCRGSAAGLLLFDRGFEGDNALVERNISPPHVCNPYTGKSIQLPPMLAITSIKLRCIVEDNNGAYKVVVIGSNDDKESIVEMYECSQQTWKILVPIPQHIIFFSLSNLVCCDGSYYCITVSPPSIFGFTITALNEGLEPTLVVPIPKPMLKNLLELQLVMCGSRLLVAAPMEKVVVIWELESLNKQRHPLSTNSNTTPWAWKEIARMPASMWEDFKHQGHPQRYKCTGVGDNVCFTTVYEESIKVVIYNLSTRSWSLLPKCPWRKNNYWRHGLRCVIYFTTTMAFQPRLRDIVHKQPPNL